MGTLGARRRSARWSQARPPRSSQTSGASAPGSSDRSPGGILESDRTWMSSSRDWRSTASARWPLVSVTGCACVSTYCGSKICLGGFRTACLPRASSLSPERSGRRDLAPGPPFTMHDGGPVRAATGSSPRAPARSRGAVGLQAFLPACLRRESRSRPTARQPRSDEPRRSAGVSGSRSIRRVLAAGSGRARGVKAQRTSTSTSVATKKTTET
jgi:hypothetical protein